MTTVRRDRTLCAVTTVRRDVLVSPREDRAEGETPSHAGLSSRRDTQKEFHAGLSSRRGTHVPSWTAPAPHRRRPRLSSRGDRALGAAARRPAPPRPADTRSVSRLVGYSLCVRARVRAFACVRVSCRTPVEDAACPTQHPPPPFLPVSPPPPSLSPSPPLLNHTHTHTHTGATMIGHFPWFYTYNAMDASLPPPKDFLPAVGKYHRV